MPNGHLGYWLGQLTQMLRSLSSEQREINRRLDQLTRRVEEALSWAQRLILLGLAWLSAMGLNWSPEKIGEVLAGALKALK